MEPSLVDHIKEQFHCISASRLWKHGTIMPKKKSKMRSGDGCKQFCKDRKKETDPNSRKVGDACGFFFWPGLSDPGGKPCLHITEPPVQMSDRSDEKNR